MTRELAADPGLGRLADAVLIPPFTGGSPPDWIRAAISGGLGGVTLFGPNVYDREQLARLTASLRGAGSEPVIAIDEEGGDVTRISHRTGSDYPGNAALGAVDDVALTSAVYAAMGADLAALGINMDLAPSVDVNTAADNPVIGTRAFGADPALVARHGAAAVAGLQSAGVAACAKHFPGHGSTTLDSHLVLATVDAPLSLLRERELPPFEAAIAAGVRAIMPSHLRVPELTGDLPASLSHRALTGLLRGDLGFDGVIVSDGLEMRAVSEPYGIPEAAVQAVIAGTDLLCLGRDQDRQSFLAVRTALVAAVQEGRLPAARLEDAAARVAELRGWVAGARAAARDGLATAAGTDPGVYGRLGPAAGASTAPTGGGIGLAAARRAIAVRGDLRTMTRPLVVQLVPPSNLAVGSVPWGLADFVPPGSYREISTATPAAELPGVVSAVLAAAAGRSLIIVVRDAHRHPVASAAVQLLLAERPDAVVLEMGLPVWRPDAATYVASYGAARSNSRAAAEFLGLTSQ
jgi:beta-N-acetylhexosaminidase